MAQLIGKDLERYPLLELGVAVRCGRLVAIDQAQQFALKPIQTPLTGPPTQTAPGR